MEHVKATVHNLIDATMGREGKEGGRKFCRLECQLNLTPQRVTCMNETVFKGKRGTILQIDAEEIW